MTSGGGQTRSIGVGGTLARFVVGTAMVGGVAVGHITGTFHLAPWVVGLVAFPSVVLAWHRWRTQGSPERLVATGPIGHVAGVVVFLALYLTWWYAPALDAVSDAALLFYGSSMLLAAARGAGRCEVLAFSNWALRRDDEVGCVLFEPIDRLERRAGRHVGAGVESASTAAR